MGAGGPGLSFKTQATDTKKNSSSSSSEDGGYPIKQPSFHYERPSRTRYTNQPTTINPSTFRHKKKKKHSKQRQQRRKQRARVGLKSTTLTPNARRQAGSPVREIVSAGTRTRKGNIRSLTGCLPTPNPSRTHTRGLHQGGAVNNRPPL